MNDLVARLTRVLLDARMAIASLDMDALGWVNEPEASWPMREELLHNIDNALTQARQALASRDEPKP